MRIGIASYFGCGLSIWTRLQAEGHDVRVWIQPQSHKSIGEGIITHAGQFPELLAWCKDGARSGTPTLMLFDSSNLGDKADEARKAGLAVVGGGSFCDKLEKDRDFGFKIAREAGCNIPEFKEFPSISATMAWAKSQEIPPVFWKTDKYLTGDTTHGAENSAELVEYLEGVQRDFGDRIKNIVQKKIDGTPLSTARWWNGKDWVGPYEGTYENKKFMNDDVGPSTGCSFNAVWFYDEEEPKIARLLGWEKLSDSFRKNEAPAGLYDINAVVDHEGEAWFLEWTPRFGYDSEPTSFRLIPDLGAHLYCVAYGHTPAEPSGSLAYALRLSVPPYPWEHGSKDDKGSAHGTRVLGVDGLWDGNFIGYCLRIGDLGLECAGPEGVVGLSLAVGEDVEDLGQETLDYAKSLNVAGLGYRTDGAKDCAEKGAELAAAGIDVHPGLLVEID